MHPLRCGMNQGLVWLTGAGNIVGLINEVTLL